MLRLILLLLALPVFADIRVATFNASLNRDGPGRLVGDLEDGDDDQIAAVVATIVEVSPDILLINELDWDPDGVALGLFQAALAEAGADYPHAFAGITNTGMPSGLDLNGDGEVGGPADAWGFGFFPGQYGMALLSRFPIEDTRTFAELLWADTGHPMPVVDGAPWPSAEVAAARRLSSKSHWDVRIATPGGPLHILASHPTPPVFDGPEDLNGLRNAAEILVWVDYLDGAALTDDAGRAAPLADAPFVILGDLNADPVDGDGILSAVGRLLSHPRVADPAQASLGAVAAAEAQAGANAAQTGPAAQDTADFRDGEGQPGNLRVDYALPSADLTVTGAGVFWPAPGAPGAAWMDASDHRLVWVDVAR